MWTITIQEYINNTIENFENQFNKRGLKLKARSVTPTEMRYQPEIYSSQELDQDGISIFQELIGILRWVVEIFRVGILTDISKLSSYQDSPREVYLEKYTMWLPS